jgi:hypothetical protein
MAFKPMDEREFRRLIKMIEKYLQVALKEIGEIKPWFDEEVNAWVFEHKAYNDC